MIRNIKWSFLASALLVSIALYLTPSLVRAEAEVGWIKGLGDTQNEETTAVVVNATGDVYVVGAFQGTVDFDPGPGVALRTSVGSQDAFILKLDAAGNLIWSRQLPSAGYSKVNDIAVDRDGDIYVTGKFQDSIDFDPASGGASFNSKGEEDIFFAKISADGNHVWAIAVGSSESDSGEGIAVDSAKNVYITGSFEKVVDFRPGPEKYLLTSDGKDDIFIVRYDTDGQFGWARSMGGPEDAIGFDVAVESGKAVYVTGEFEGKVDLDPGSHFAEYHSKGNEDIFIVRLNTGGLWQWAGIIGGREEDERPSLDIDAGGNIYITGSFEDIADFDPRENENEMFLTSAGKEDIFLVKLHANGHLIWAKTVGGGGSDNAAGIDVDASGTIYVTGGFEQSVDFSPGAGQRILSSAGKDDVFVASYSRDGANIWAKAIHGVQDENGRDVAAAPNGDVYAVGDFQGAISIDQETISAIPHTTVHTDAFVLKLLRPVYPPRVFLPAVQQSIAVQSAERLTQSESTTLH